MHSFLVCLLAVVAFIQKFTERKMGEVITYKYNAAPATLGYPTPVTLLLTLIQTRIQPSIPTPAPYLFHSQIRKVICQADGLSTACRLCM